MSAAIWIDRGEPLEWKGAFNWNRHNIFTAFTFMAVKCLTIPPTIHAHLFDDHKDERDTCEQSCVHARTRAPLDIWENIRRIHYKLKSICGYRWLFCRCFSVFHVLFVIVERERSMKREKKANALVLPKCNSFETITGVVTILTGASPVRVAVERRHECRRFVRLFVPACICSILFMRAPWRQSHSQ